MSAGKAEQNIHVIGSSFPSQLPCNLLGQSFYLREGSIRQQGYPSLAANRGSGAQTSGTWDLHPHDPSVGNCGARWAQSLSASAHRHTYKCVGTDVEADVPSVSSSPLKDFWYRRHGVSGPVFIVTEHARPRRPGRQDPYVDIVTKHLISSRTSTKAPQYSLPCSGS